MITTLGRLAPRGVSPLLGPNPFDRHKALFALMSAFVWDFEEIFRAFWFSIAGHGPLPQQNTERAIRAGKVCPVSPEAGLLAFIWGACAALCFLAMSFCG